MSIPELSEAMIRRYASTKSWQRGEAYYSDRHVRRVVRRGNAIAAEVEGNEIRPYRVNIGFDGEELGEVSCTCPYDFGGCCKHIVATLLVCLRDPQQIEERPSIERILDRLNEVQTQRLIKELVASNPALIDDIEYFADRVAPAVVTTAESSQPQRQVTVDANRIRSQVKYILRDSVRHYEYGEEEDIATEEICSLIQDARQYTERGEPWNAIAMLTAITEACVEDWDVVEEYGVDNEEVAAELNDVWCETILNMEISEPEKVDLKVNLEFWGNEWGSRFDLAIAALANWTSEIALESGDRVLAIEAKVKAFQASPNFSDYRKIEQLTRENWTNIKGELLAALADFKGWGSEKAKVDIYLHESLIDRAIAVVDELYYDYNGLTHRVMDAAIAVNPDWVISNACRRAEAIVDAGKSDYYQEAVNWLEKARSAYISCNKQQEWTDYRTNLMTVHARKRKLMGLMRSLS